MSDETSEAVRLEDHERTAMGEQVDTLQADIGKIAQTIRDKLHDPALGPTEVRSVVSAGVKTLIVHTADGYCYVYDGKAGVCRFCTDEEAG